MVLRKRSIDGTDLRPTKAPSSSGAFGRKSRYARITAFPSFASQKIVSGKPYGPDVPETGTRDHAEVAAAAAERPEEIGMLAFAGGDEGAIGQDDVGFEQVVDRESVIAREYPVPPPRVRPATPVVETMPNGTASPNACVA